MMSHQNLRLSAVEKTLGQISRFPIGCRKHKLACVFWNPQVFHHCLQYSNLSEKNWEFGPESSQI